MRTGQFAAWICEAKIVSKRPYPPFLRNTALKSGLWDGDTVEASREVPIKHNVYNFLKREARRGGYRH
jgi:hypothetical protein